MITTRSLPVSPDQQLRNIGWNWMLGTDTLSYLTNEAVVVSPDEADAYYEAANQLFEMLVEAGQHVIDHNRFSELGIPDNLVELIKLSWNDERHIQLYGRFDLAGGLDGQPIKLIEFNADTATCIPETAVVQYAHLRANGLDEQRQFNAVYETLVAQFREILAENSDLQPTLLLSAMRGFPEDDSNVAVLGEAAREAGFSVDFEYIDKVEFSAEEGLFKQNPETGHFDKFDFWFKLLPWEYIGYEEPDLAPILTEAVRRRQVLVLNPAYSLLFQSKYILKILWEFYPYHPLLLKTDTQPLTDRPYVEKVLFGREGANVRIVDEQGRVTAEAEGEYGDYPTVFQEYVDLPTDAAGNRYQAGVFFAGEGCGLGFRRGGVILDNGAQFVGHLVE
ncbi:glutathionylspermidine synthase family protein [Larkinella sp. VNQ87]|uniref:glutathionylspermidine synthase family protein n=1 Tax=Larkinella sp. VNQ87 TaxID=3400921 RepID=UPI003C11C5ED